MVNVVFQGTGVNIFEFFMGSARPMPVVATTRNQSEILLNYCNNYYKMFFLFLGKKLAYCLLRPISNLT